jgi:hypothetical protein
LPSLPKHVQVSFISPGTLELVAYSRIPECLPWIVGTLLTLVPVKVVLGLGLTSSFVKKNKHEIKSGDLDICTILYQFLPFSYFVPLESSKIWLVATLLVVKVL